jgi:hypothetical protein
MINDLEQCPERHPLNDVQRYSPGAHRLASVVAIRVFAVVAIVFVGQLRAGEDDTDRLKPEALEGWRRLEVAGSGLEAQFTFTECIPKSKDSLLKDGRILVSGSSVLFQYKDHAQAGSATNRPVLEKVCGKNSRYVFELRNAGRDKPFILASFGQLDPVDNDRFLSYAIHYAGIPWTVEGARLWDMPLDPNFTLKSLRRVDGGLIRMDAGRWETLSRGRPDETRLDLAMTIYLDPTIGWAIRSFETKINKTWKDGSAAFLSKGAVEYVDNAPAFPPVPRRHVTTLFNLDGSERVTYRTEFPKWTYRNDIKEDEFGLAAFGLPEPVGSPPDSSVPVFIWFIVAGILCVVLAVGFRFLARRKQTASVTG